MDWKELMEELSDPGDPGLDAQFVIRPRSTAPVYDLSWHREHAGAFGKSFWLCGQRSNEGSTPRVDGEEADVEAGVLEVVQQPM
jgi:hypothetical protein